MHTNELNLTRTAKREKLVFDTNIVGNFNASNPSRYINISKTADTDPIT